MKGDFSDWRFNPNENFNGVLQQQGKVLLDRDWNEQTRITKHWQDTAGRDAIGPQVAAVPAGAPNGFKVESAFKTTVGGQDAIELTLDPGRAWADGLLAYLPPADPAAPTVPVTREATYLQPPLQDPASDITSLAEGIRDCVVLELSRESFNGFQWPTRLIEPALGGPDTTERVHTKLSFKLWRLADDEDCHTIHDKLQDDPSKFGKLTVSLQPTTTVPGDCPVVEGGGYTGFEHNLYRIEIADVTSGEAMFKWSQWNGGLVGRGTFDASGTPSKVVITANQTAIINSGLSSFYLEALAYDSDLGCWNVIYGAMATLNNDNDLELGATPVFGTFPTSADPVFFRLWNGIDSISDYTNSGTPVELRDGIQLVFDVPGAGVFYRPGDYWTFPVRAGEIKNPDTLIDDQPPIGIIYHRVPLAVVTWGASLDTTVDGEIEDCRRRFRPLTQLDTCCTVRVGDGDTSIGDFEKIQDAINALPDEGGEVCILPGTYTENITLLNLQNVTLSGCGPRTIIQSPAPAEGATADPVISVIGGQNITLESFAVEADDSGTGILMQGQNWMYYMESEGGHADGLILNATIAKVQVSAGLKSAIRAEYINGLVIRDCALSNTDESNNEHTLAVLADNALIERNRIEVAGERFKQYGEMGYFSPGNMALGGLQLEGSCDSVRVVDNVIRGGSGHGITLGSLIPVDQNGDPVPPDNNNGGEPIDPCAPTQPAGVIIDEIDVEFLDGSTGQLASGGALYGITIEHNCISQMGVCGIGVVGFFDLSAQDQFISVSGLNIVRNDICQNLRRELSAIPADKQNTMGYGGISLADVENLVIQDNTIAGNGANAADPICGIFVLHAEGIDISRNRITENGIGDGTDPSANPWTGAHLLALTKTGRRGGIVVIYGLAPATSGTIATQSVVLGTGAPAVKIHGNVVTTPIGPALWLRALGPVSVLGNQLASRGIVQSGASTTILGAAVAIENLGLSEEFYLQFIAYAAIANGSVSIPQTPSGAPSAIVLPTPSTGLDDFGAGRLLANGNVLFAENQVLLNLIETGATLTFSAITILSLDDISFHGNQCDCDLALGSDYIYFNMFSFGFSIRAHDNRFKEGLLNALFSAAVLGFFASASGNQATHCLLVEGFLPALTIKTPNSVLMSAILPDYCEKFEKMIESFGNKTGF